VYGPVQTEEGWRIRNSDELEKLMRGEDIVRYIIKNQLMHFY
jgi:hypothetical protein